jgi:4-hydroxy-2-oxoheptanedioate aldolase
MTRINKTVELLAQGQPIYYTGSDDRGYEGGLAAAKTWADYINYDLEHHPFDVTKLHDFMRGLVDGGPTPSGHRTPAVIVTLPTNGSDLQAFRANEWMVRQVLATGIHGILLCHAESPAAVKAFVESTRYPFQTIGREGSNGLTQGGTSRAGLAESRAGLAESRAGLAEGRAGLAEGRAGLAEGRAGLAEGRRGSGGQAMAAAIWGIPIDDYLRRAEPWPLNPDGELLLGLKIENVRALAAAEETTAIPGIAFAEWGPGDMGMSLGLPDAHDPPYPPQMLEARAKVLAACKTHNVAFLEQVTPENVIDQIKAGVMVGAGHAAEQAAAIGRQHTNRPQPW